MTPIRKSPPSFHVPLDSDGGRRAGLLLFGAFRMLYCGLCEGAARKAVQKVSFDGMVFGVLSAVSELAVVGFWYIRGTYHFLPPIRLSAYAGQEQHRKYPAQGSVGHVVFLKRRIHHILHPATAQKPETTAIP